MQERSKETRTRILQAALEEFSQHGYDATGLAEICTTAGVSKGAFYHHFKSKQAVFLELLHIWLDQLDQQLQTVRGIALPVPQSIQLMTSLMGQVYQVAENHLAMFLEFWSQAKRDPKVWEAVIAPYQRYQDYFSDLVEEGIQQGSLKPVDPHMIARMIVSLAVGLLLQGLLDPHGADWAETTQQGFHLLIQTISTEAI